MQAQQSSMSKNVNKAADEIKGTIAGRLADVKDQVVSFAHTEAEQVGKWADKAVKQGSVYIDKLERTIRSRPLMAVGVAAGIGIVAVNLLLRPFSRK